MVLSLTQLAQEAELVFVVRRIPMFPQMIYYAQGNMQLIDSLEYAKRWLKNSDAKERKAIMFDRFESY